MTIASAALSRRARSAAWFAAGTVSTSATSATMASGHQIFALISSSVNLSNTIPARPPEARTPPTIPPRPADANSRRAGPKGLTCRGARNDQEGLLDNEAGVPVDIVGQLGARTLHGGQRRDEAADLDGRRRVPVQVEAQGGRSLNGRRDPVAEERRGRQQDPVHLIAFGPALAPGEPGLDPPDRPAVRLLGPPLLVAERRELLVQLGAESFLVGGRRVEHIGRGREGLAGSGGGSRERIGGNVAEREAFRVGRHPAGASEVPARQTRDQLGPDAVDALALELLDHERLRQRRE